MIEVLTTSLTTLVLLGTANLLLYFKHRKSRINLWLAHPLFLFNGVTVLTFFAPYLFHLVFGTIDPTLFLTEGNNTTDLLVLCGSLILLNFVFLTVELVAKEKKGGSHRKTIVTNKDLLFISVLFFAVLLGSVISVWSNAYYFGAFAQGKEVSLSLSGLGPLQFLLGFVKYFVLTGLSLLYFTRFKRDKGFKLLFWFLLTMNIFFAFFSGSKALILMPFLIFGFCHLLFKKKGLLKTVIGVLLVLIAFFSLYNVWRIFAVHSTNSTFEEFLLTKSRNLDKGLPFFMINNFMVRMDTFANYLILTDFYPDKISFLEGRSYLVTLTSPIPRFLFSSKPIAVDDGDIGRKTGLIAENDYVTTPATPWWAEGYINFGYLGVFLVPFAALFFYEAFFIFWLRHKSNFLITVSYFTFLLYIPFTIHSGVGGLFGDFLKFLVFLTPLFLVIYLPSKNENRN